MNKVDRDGIVYASTAMKAAILCLAGEIPVSVAKEHIEREEPDKIFAAVRLYVYGYVDYEWYHKKIRSEY